MNLQSTITQKLFAYFAIGIKPKVSNNAENIKSVVWRIQLTQKVLMF